MILKCVFVVISTIVPSFVLGNSDLEKRFDELSKETADLNRRLTHLEVKNLALDKRVQHLEVENEQLKSAKATLEERVEYLEAITRKDVPRTCQDLKLLGVSKSGSYLIDPDGAGLGEAPITVTCDMSSANGITLVPHNLVDVVTEVEHCPDPGCHKTEIKYDAPLRQMRALMDLSSECSQEIQYNCFIAPLIENGVEIMAWWTGADGEANYYWDGSHNPTDHTCACDQDGTCENEVFSCNCDSGAPEWLSDNGNLTNMTALPVREVHFGGLIYDAQVANFGVGYLTCQGRKEFRATESCETLRMTGQVTSGYYFVDGPAGIHHDLVFCDMELESSDANFQVDTAVKLPEYPVAFDAHSLVNNQITNAAVLTWGATHSNEGNAFDPATGTFTAPFDGVYKFTLFIHEMQNSNTMWVYIRKNGSEVAWVYDESASDEDRGTGSASVILVLSEGDTVDAYMSPSGHIYNGISSQFMGHLLFLLP